MISYHLDAELSDRIILRKSQKMNQKDEEEH